MTAMHGQVDEQHDEEGIEATHTPVDALSNFGIQVSLHGRDRPSPLLQSSLTLA